jgi:hypothetical protein
MDFLVFFPFIANIGLRLGIFRKFLTFFILHVCGVCRSRSVYACARRRPVSFEMRSSYRIISLFDSKKASTRGPSVSWFVYIYIYILEIHACNNPSPVFKRCLLSAVASTSSQGVCEVR